MVSTQNTRADTLPTLVKKARELDLEPRLLDAVIEVESNWRPYRARFEQGFNDLVATEKFARLQGISRETERVFQKISWGLGQVMGGTARWLGFAGPLPALCDPVLGVHYCATYLSYLSKRYVKIEDVIAAYNAGSLKYNAKNELINQAYVDKVITAYVSLGSEEYEQKGASKA